MTLISADWGFDLMRCRRMRLNISDCLSSQRESARYSSIAPEWLFRYIFCGLWRFSQFLALLLWASFAEQDLKNPIQEAANHMIGVVFEVFWRTFLSIAWDFCVAASISIFFFFSRVLWICKEVFATKHKKIWRKNDSDYLNLKMNLIHKHKFNW